MRFLRSRLVQALLSEGFWRNVRDVAAATLALATERFREAHIVRVDLEARLSSIENEQYIRENLDW